MASYSISFRPSIRKDLRRLPRTLVPRIIERIEALADNPFSQQSVKLSGDEEAYRIRIGNYRVVYEVDTRARRITILYVRHRREVYRRF